MMNFTCGWYVANSILKRSFEDKIYITSLKLNCLLYLLYSDYLYRYGNKLFNELFVKTSIGPCIPSVCSKFDCFGNDVIDNYAKDAVGRVLVVNGDNFNECLSYVWNTYKYMDDNEILDLVNNFNAVYKKKIDQCLNDVDILDDEIKRNNIILQRAKVYRKNMKN